MALAGNQTLTTLDVGGNHIGNAGATAFSIKGINDVWIINVEEGIGIGMPRNKNPNVVLHTSGLIMCVALVIETADQIFLAHIVPPSVHPGFTLVNLLSYIISGVRAMAGVDHSHIGIRLYVASDSTFNDPEDSKERATLLKMCSA